jgi:hypothetical protein
MTTQKTSNLRKINYVCKRLEITRKQLSKILNKSINTLNQYSSDDKLLSYDDVALIYKYIAAKQPEYQEYMKEIFAEMQDNV